jgi:hypothetical protein
MFSPCPPLPRLRNLASAAGILILGLAGSAHADKVWLTNGNYLEGEARDHGDEVEILSSLGSIRIASSRVARIERAETIEERVQTFFDQHPGADAEQLFEMALACEDEGAATLANLIYQRILRLDRDHEGARRALGYRFYDGQWLTDQQMHERRGEIRFRGEWMTPENKIRILAEEGQQQNQLLERQLLIAQIQATQDRAAQERAAQRQEATSGGGIPLPYVWTSGPAIPPHLLPPAVPALKPPESNERPLKKPWMVDKGNND